MSFVSPVAPVDITLPKSWEEARPILETLLGKRGSSLNRIVEVLNGRLTFVSDGTEDLPSNMDVGIVEFYSPSGIINQLLNNPLGRELLGIIPIYVVGLKNFSLASYPPSTISPEYTKYDPGLDDGISVTQNSKDVTRVIGGDVYPFTSDMEKGYLLMPDSASYPQARLKIETVVDTDNLTLQDPWPGSTELNQPALIQWRWHTDTFYICTTKTFLWGRLLVF